MPPPPLIGALLRVPWEVVRDRMLAGLHARGFTDLTAAHLDVLQYPGPQDARPSELAARTRMTKQALNYLLGQLEQRGYLRRRNEPGDGRSKRIVLTARGHRTASAIREIVAEVEAEWERGLAPGEFDELRRLLARLNSVVAGPDRQRASGQTSAVGDEERRRHAPRHPDRARRRPPGGYR